MEALTELNVTFGYSGASKFPLIPMQLMNSFQSVSIEVGATLSGSEKLLSTLKDE